LGFIIRKASEGAISTSVRVWFVRAASGWRYFVAVGAALLNAKKVIDRIDVQSVNVPIKARSVVVIFHRKSSC